MLSRSKRMERFLIGFIASSLVTLTVFICYTLVINEPGVIDKSKMENGYLIPDAEQKNIAAAINDLNIREIRLEEKVLAINKRFDDLYILGGVIITLILAISLSVYLRVGAEVEKYFKEHYKHSQDRIDKCVIDAEVTLGILYARTVLIEQWIAANIPQSNPSIQQGQNIETQNDHNDH